MSMYVNIMYMYVCMSYFIFIMRKYKEHKEKWS